MSTAGSGFGRLLLRMGKPAEVFDDASTEASPKDRYGKRIPIPTKVGDLKVIAQQIAAREITTSPGTTVVVDWELYTLPNAQLDPLNFAHWKREIRMGGVTYKIASIADDAGRGDHLVILASVGGR